VPQRVAERHPHVFRLEDSGLQDTHSLVVCHPISLHSVILLPLSPGISRQNLVDVVEWLSSSRTILHATSTISVPVAEHALQHDVSNPLFKVKMLEPSTSGYIDKKYTRVVLVQDGIQQDAQVNGVRATLSDEDDSSSIYDIDEHFLSNMVDLRMHSTAEVRVYTIAQQYSKD
jgi:hypothetical protein